MVRISFDFDKLAFPDMRQNTTGSMTARAGGPDSRPDYVRVWRFWFRFQSGQGSSFFASNIKKNHITEMRIT
jgi:hypothetical protein